MKTSPTPVKQLETFAGNYFPSATSLSLSLSPAFVSGTNCLFLQLVRQLGGFEPHDTATSRTSSCGSSSPSPSLPRANRRGTMWRASGRAICVRVTQELAHCCRLSLDEIERLHSDAAPAKVGGRARPRRPVGARCQKLASLASELKINPLIDWRDHQPAAGRANSKCRLAHLVGMPLRLQFAVSVSLARRSPSAAAHLAERRTDSRAVRATAPTIAFFVAARQDDNRAN